jgi:hypothetical protein
MEIHRREFLAAALVGSISSALMPQEPVSTRLAIDFIRAYGFDNEFQSAYVLEGQYTMDKAITDIDVEKMVTRLVSETREMLSQNILLLKKLSRALAAQGKLEPREIVAIGAEFGVQTEVREEGYLKINAFDAKLNA